MAVCKLCFVIQHAQAFCLGVLIAAAVALLAINETEEIANRLGGDYEDASNYRAAARASITTSSIAIAFHVLMIILRCIYLFPSEEKFRSYAIIVSNHSKCNDTQLEYQYTYVAIASYISQFNNSYIAKYIQCMCISCLLQMDFSKTITLYGQNPFLKL